MKSFSKIYYFNAPLQEVFEALTNPDIIEKWTGSVAFMDARPGGKFSLWDDSINGKNVVIEPNRIVQDWKEETWEKYSRVTINLRETPNGTELELIHENIPPLALYNIKQGWDESFMLPIKDLLEEKPEEED